MRLYFWDWGSSLRIQACDMQMPWRTREEAGKEDCYTSLESARWNARIDLQARISELQAAMDALDDVTVRNVEVVESMPGL